MRDYSRLTRRLQNERGSQLPLSFAEVEQIIADSLPPSAHRHQAWWSNTESHSHAASWMNPGWRTANVNVPGQRVTFIKAEERATRASRPEHSARQASPDLAERTDADVFPKGLYPGARRILEVRCEREGIDWEAAIAQMLNEAAEGYWRGVWAEVNARSSGVSETTGAEMIRELRDGE